MKSLAIANQKGGVGKTTLATHLAWYLADQGKSVLFVDIDPQANATSSLKSYTKDSGLTSSQLFQPTDVAPPSPAAGEIVLIGADPKLVDLDSKPHGVLTTFNGQLRAMAEPFDYLLVDVGPSLGNRMLASLLTTDALLCPIEPEKYAIDGVNTMIATFRQAQQIKVNANRNGANFPAMHLLGVFLTKVTRTFPRHRATVQELVEKHGHVILPTWLPTRSAVGEAQSANVPVWQMGTASSREAAKEMRAACEFIIDKLEATT